MFGGLDNTRVLHFFFLFAKLLDPTCNLQHACRDLLLGLVDITILFPPSSRPVPLNPQPFPFPFPFSAGVQPPASPSSSTSFFLAFCRVLLFHATEFAGVVHARV